MRNLKFLFFLVALTGLVLTNQSCKDDEGDPTPTCTDGIQNGDETGVDCGGDCAACPTCDDGIQNGEETGVDCGGPDCDACPVGLQDTKWQSSGTNVAQLLQLFFMTDSIYVEFNKDFTYYVEQYDESGVKTTFEGTYGQTESSVAGIWDITLNQSLPSPTTVVGIFQITDDTLKYEVVQTEPPLGTPPTATDGFGSTNGGALTPPDANVQTYIRL